MNLEAEVKAHAAPPEGMAGGAQVALEALVFEVGGQRYGVRSAEVLEIVRAVSVTPLPGAPAVVEGVINLRGTVVPVLDIRSRFRIAPRGSAHTDHFIVAQVGPRRVALRVDRAVELVRLEAGQIEDAPGTVPGVGHVAGVAKTADGLVLIHDLQTFLSAAEATSLDEACAQAGESPGG
jgi:purine-binding chemotaxis protein CheW